MAQALTFAPNGRTIASGGDDKTIRLWDIDTGEELAQLTGHTERINDIAISPDGQTLASCSMDHTVRLWNANTGHPLTKLNGHTSNVEAIAFSSDGSILVSGSSDETIRFWDMHTCKFMQTLEVQSPRLRNRIFSRWEYPCRCRRK